MSTVEDLLKAAGVDPSRFRIGQTGKIQEAETRTPIRTPRIHRGHGWFKHSKNPNALKPGGGETGSQGNGQNSSSN